MKEIDFLPPAYREQSAIHSARLCQLAVAGAFGCVIALAACYQFALYHSARQELADLAELHDDAIAKTAQLAALRVEVDQTRQYAELYSYLRYPWPRTQLLAEIVKNQPTQVTIVELTIVEESPKSNPRNSVIAVDVGKDPTAGTAAQVDLDLLRRQQDQRQTELEVSGTTTESGAVHLFVMALNGTPLFDSAKLHSMEAVAGGDQAQSKFLVRLTVRPGYGQPGGPQAPPSMAVQADAKRSLDPS